MINLNERSLKAKSVLYVSICFGFAIFAAFLITFSVYFDDYQCLKLYVLTCFCNWMSWHVLFGLSFKIPSFPKTEVGPMFHNTLNALHGLFENQQLIHDIHIWKKYTQLHNTTKKKNMQNICSQSHKHKNTMTMSITLQRTWPNNVTLISVQQKASKCNGAAWLISDRWNTTFYFYFYSTERNLTALFQGHG